MSTAAASHLSPAFPGRAAWGTASKLRVWQADALAQYLRSTPRDFLAVATPGAGKTTYALRVATELLSMGAISRVTVVAPTEHLKTQWADAASRVGPLGLQVLRRRDDGDPADGAHAEQLGRDAERISGLARPWGRDGEEVPGGGAQVLSQGVRLPDAQLGGGPPGGPSRESW